MVAAGVYMLCRVFFIFTPDALLTIACIGGFTALLAALIAVQQNDIKRILAYSTLSQLGYMVMAVGLGGPTPAMFHLVTHAFFKALLFLGAGSVIFALHHEQDIWKMGGLKKSMPVTHLTFLLGTLALCGVPPFSGFYSKDAILAVAWEHNKLLFGTGVLVAVLTPFYMFRLFFVAFEGQPRVKKSHAHESGRSMAWPLRILALLSVCAAFFGIEPLLTEFFGGEAQHASLAEQVAAPFLHAPVAAFSGLFAVAIGFLAARALYAQAKTDPLPSLLGALARGMQNRFYFDELYAGLIRVTQEMMARLADGFDRWIIEGFGIGLVRGGTDLTGRALRLLQTGNVQTYAFLFAAGLALILWFVIGI
jgi:NADH-quinone oxidoreductase subunit L